MDAIRIFTELLSCPGDRFKGKAPRERQVAVKLTKLTRVVELDDGELLLVTDGEGLRVVDVFEDVVAAWRAALAEETK